MKASEALKHLSGNNFMTSHLQESLELAREALREKAEREEQARPKVTLEEQIDAVQWASGNEPPMGVKLYAAADTLRRLREEGASFLSNGYYHGDLVKWLRDLGVEPR